MYNRKNECKLMILYLLRNVNFNLTHECLSNFFLDKYTYIEFQEILSELLDTKLVEEYKTKNTICYKATTSGKAALDAFVNEITESHKKAIDKYIKDNKITLKEQSIIKSNYTDGVEGRSIIYLEISETPKDNFKIEIDVPSTDIATTMCENWKNKAKNIYKYVMKQLL